jgi:hypothetical protein
MPSDSDLRRRFREGTQPRGEIDVDAVLRRARARRRPRVVLAAAGSVLAIAAIAVPAVVVNGLGAGSGGAADQAYSAGDAAAAPESATGGAAETELGRSSAKTLNACGAPVAQPEPADAGLTLTMAPVTARGGARDIPVTVTLTNTGTAPIFGSTASQPTLTLSHDGVTVWHSGLVSDASARLVDLGPGESMTYETSFDALVCVAGEDDVVGPGAELPAAPAGTYLLWASIDVVHDDGTAVELVTGPAVAVTLR